MTTILSPGGTGLDTIDPATHPGHDAVRFRAIRAAAKNVETAEQELHDAALTAREAGDSWATSAPPSASAAKPHSRAALPGR